MGRIITKTNKTARCGTSSERKMGERMRKRKQEATDALEQFVGFHNEKDFLKWENGTD